MVDKWVGKIAVVTGASAGIGAAIFKDLAEAGITVIGLARRVEKVQDLIKNLSESAKKKAFAHKCDVSDSKSIKDTFKWIENKFGVVHILINNAGVIRNVFLLDDSDEATKKMTEIIDTNIHGLTQCTREAFRLMKKSDVYGYIININSVAGHYVPFFQMPFSVYPGSKHAVTAITETIRHELVWADNKKVRITSLSPGGVATEIGLASGLMTAEQFNDPNINFSQGLAPSDISDGIMYLLSTPYTVNVTELTIRPTGEKM